MLGEGGRGISCSPSRFFVLCCGKGGVCANVVEARFAPRLKVESVPRSVGEDGSGILGSPSKSLVLLIGSGGVYATVVDDLLGALGSFGEAGKGIDGSSESSAVLP